MNRQLLAYRLIFLVEVFILRRHYPSGRTWANILCVHLGYTSLVYIKTSTRRIMRLDELPFVVLRSRRISKESSSRRVMCLVPVFILEMHKLTNYKCLPKFVQSDNASSSIKKANKMFTLISCSLF